MKYTFEAVNRFTAALYALKDLNDVLQLQMTQSECRAIVLDSAHVSVSFVSWHCQDDGATENGTVCIGIQALLTALSMSASSSSPFSIVMDSFDSDTMTVCMDGGDTVVHLRLMDRELETLTAPDFETAMRVVFETARFRDVCRELSLIGDTVTFQSDGQSLILVTTGNIGNARITLRPEQVVHAAPITPLSISLRYINSVLKSWTVSTHVSLSFVTDMPLCILLESPDVSLKCYIAPKLEEES